MFTLKDDCYICDKPIKWYINESQIMDNTVNEYTVFGFGVIECGSETKTYTHGAVITTIPKAIEDAPNGLKALIYDKGDVFCKGTTTIKDSTYVELYYTICLQGKLPTNIPYMHQRIIRDNVLANNVRINVPALYLDINHAYMFKSKNNTLKEYRLDMEGEYVVMNPRESVSSSTGTFGSSTFEDPVNMTLINVTRKKSEEAQSVLEDYMLM